VYKKEPSKANFKIDCDMLTTTLVLGDKTELFTFNTKVGFDLETIRALKIAVDNYLEDTK
jgi:hypothetical protein